jgi:hypothetical protein
MSEPSVHVGRVAFDFEILRRQDDPSKMLLRQSRDGQIHQLTLDTADGADLVGAILETVASAHPSFFDEQIRPLLQTIVDHRLRQQKP